MLHFDSQLQLLVGEGGSLPIQPDDEVTSKFLMLLEGECLPLGPVAAAQKFGFSKQRYFQLRKAFCQQGIDGLQNHKRGPKTNYRCSDELVRQVIRHRFLDPAVSASVIAQKLRQAGFVISTRSVERIISHYGLQKKTLSLPADQ